jgi:hypothetical protein
MAQIYLKYYLRGSKKGTVALSKIVWLVRILKIDLFGDGGSIWNTFSQLHTFTFEKEKLLELKHVFVLPIEVETGKHGTIAQ